MRLLVLIHRNVGELAYHHVYNITCYIIHWYRNVILLQFRGGEGIEGGGGTSIAIGMLLDPTRLL